jgi:hypothetical protein
MANWKIGLNTVGYEVLLPLPGDSVRGCRVRADPPSTR